MTLSFESISARASSAIKQPVTWVFILLFALMAFLYAMQGKDEQSDHRTVEKLASLHKRPAQAFETGALAGRRLCDLYTEYLGLPCRSVIPNRLKVNWDQTLTNLWARKVDRSPHNRVVSTTSIALVSGYIHGNRGLTTFAEYKQTASRVSNETWLALNWQKVGAIYYHKMPKAVAARKLKLLRDIAGQVRGRDLMSYGAAELMPSANGKLNRAFIGFILSNGGREWFERVPAEHDGWTSYGFFQFTSFALYDAHGERRGASKPNQALPASLRVPGSVMLLRGDDHFRAAYLFAVDNLAQFIRKLNGHEMTVLERIWRGRDLDVAEFVALAHHSPGTAYDAGRRWLDHGGTKEFKVSTSRIGHIYAAKAAANYEAFN